MYTWLTCVIQDVCSMTSFLLKGLVLWVVPREKNDRLGLAVGLIPALAASVFFWFFAEVRNRDQRSLDESHAETDPPPLANPLPSSPTNSKTPKIATRPEPSSFKPRSYLPPMKESKASGPINQKPFFPQHDLVLVEDSRVWWESEHDQGDTEDDHMMHRAMEKPFRRLVELVSLAGGVLKVQDAYRPTGIHSSRSLHKEGRALDLTAEKISLEKLAKLCWMAGFDWVYYEVPKKSGVHIHTSVRAD